MLGWAEVYMHFFDFFHVVFVACCCNPCEAFKMFIGEAVSRFSLYSVHGWECWLASVCAHKEGHHFLHKWLQSGKIFRHQTPEVTNTCSEFNFENVFCLQFYHFTFYSSTLCRAEQSDSLEWEMTHLCGRGFQWSRKSPCAHSHPWIWIQIPPSALPKHSQILCGWRAPAEMGHLWWQLWVWGSELILCQVYTGQLFCSEMLWLHSACCLEAYLFLEASS